MISVVKRRFMFFAEFLHRKIFGHEMSEEMRKFLGHLSWSFLGIFFSGIILFAINVLAGRIIGPAGYGKYSLVLVAVNILTIPILLGFDTTSVKYISGNKYENEKNQYLSNSFWVTLLMSLVILILGSLFYLEFSRVFVLDKNFVFLSIFLAIVLSFKNLFDSFIRSFAFFKFQSAVKILESLIVILFFVLFFWILKFNEYQYYVLALIFGSMVICFVYFFKIKNKIVRWDKKKFKDVLSYSKTNISLIIILLIMSSMDKIFIGKTLGVEKVGIYSAYIASTTIFVIQIMMIFDNIFFPAISKIEDKKEVVKKIDRLSLIIFSPAIIIIFACSLVIMHIFGSKFQLNIFYSLLFSVVSFMHIPGSFYKNILSSDILSYNKFKKLMSFIPLLFFVGYVVIFWNKLGSFFLMAMLYAIYITLTLLFARLSVNKIYAENSKEN